MARVYSNTYKSKRPPQLIQSGLSGVKDFQVCKSIKIVCPSYFHQSPTISLTYRITCPISNHDQVSKTNMSTTTTKKFHRTPNGELAREIAELAKSCSENPELQEKLKHLEARVTDLDEYLENTASPQTCLQKNIWEDTMKEDWEGNFLNGRTEYELTINCISGHVEGQFLRIIAEMMKAEQILEIGVFTGYSAISLAQSPYAKEVVGLEIEPYCEEFMRKRIGNNSEVGDKIRIIIGPGLEGLEKLKNKGKTFDLIFIDADKVNYINYYKYIMDNSLLNPTGAFLIDNVLWKSEVYPEGSTTIGKALHDFNEFVKNDDRVIQVIIPLRDGVTLIRPKVPGGIYGN